MIDSSRLSPQGKTRIYFLCHQPEQQQLEYYQSFCDYGYDVAVIVDDISWNLNNSLPLRVIKISDEDCMAAGFMGVNPAIRKPLPVSAWDKALCSIHYSEGPFLNLWLIEDDVLIPGPVALANLDRNYPTDDLLTASITTFDSFSAWPGPSQGWMWFDHMPKRLLPLPWAHGMVCAVRLSMRLAQEATSILKSHATSIEQRNRHRQRLAHLLYGCRFPRSWAARLLRPKYLFIEYLFHTLAVHKQMEISTPEELSTILWRHAWQPEHMLPNYLYHPVKNLKDHHRWRAQINEHNG